MGTGVLYWGVKSPKSDDDHSLPCSVEVGMSGATLLLYL